MARITNEERMQQLTEEKFDQLRPKLKRLSVGAVEVAYAVLVQGTSQAEVARQTGRTRSGVQNICKRVMDRIEDIPPGWVKAEVCLPPTLMAKVIQMEKDARLARENAEKLAGKKK